MSSPANQAYAASGLITDGIWCGEQLGIIDEKPIKTTVCSNSVSLSSLQLSFKKLLDNSNPQTNAWRMAASTVEVY